MSCIQGWELSPRDSADRLPVMANPTHHAVSAGLFLPARQGSSTSSIARQSVENANHGYFSVLKFLLREMFVPLIAEFHDVMQAHRLKNPRSHEPANKITLSLTL